MARLRTHVHVTDDNGQAHIFAPGDEVPDWAAKKITNPKAWDEAPAGVESRDPETDPSSPPPRAGRGSSKDAWARFAAAHGVELGEDATRDDYVAELERRGVVQPKE